ncbi:MAG: 16S rRNA (guanine(527)-N(7))-methyltransferase RsmG [Alphaproteobacteria bacterium]|nr:16S rRNA (guanine(527)-N(7))-methyltransferase RsmG [Alphaproteobacteria bacterium]
MSAVGHLSQRDAFRAALGASSAAMEKLDHYEAMLRRWQRAINLVSASTLDQVWSRHFLDSAQLFGLLPDPACSVLDIGTGAGFPGLVLAMLGARDVHLVDSDTRKCGFVSQVARETGTRVSVHPVRIEALQAGQFDVVTARACAPLDRLITLAQPHVHADTVCLFPKGRSVARELDTIAAGIRLRVSAIPSLSSPGSTVVRMEGLGDGT